MSKTNPWDLARTIMITENNYCMQGRATIRTRHQYNKIYMDDRSSEKTINQGRNFLFLKVGSTNVSDLLYSQKFSIQRLQLKCKWSWHLIRLFRLPIHIISCAIPNLFCARKSTMSSTRKHTHTYKTFYYQSYINQSAFVHHGTKFLKNVFHGNIRFTTCANFHN